MVIKQRCAWAGSDPLYIRCHFDAYVWRFVDGRQKANRWRSPSGVPAETAESRALSKDLSRRGIGFVGPTICYAFMQAVGLVNEHLVDCFRFKEIDDLTPGADAGTETP